MDQLQALCSVASSHAVSVAMHMYIVNLVSPPTSVISWDDLGRRYTHCALSLEITLFSKSDLISIRCDNPTIWKEGSMRQFGTGRKVISDKYRLRDAAWHVEC